MSLASANRSEASQGAERIQNMKLELAPKSQKIIPYDQDPLGREFTARLERVAYLPTQDKITPIATIM